MEERIISQISSALIASYNEFSFFLGEIGQMNELGSSQFPRVSICVFLKALAGAGLYSQLPRRWRRGKLCSPEGEQAEEKSPAGQPESCSHTHRESGKPLLSFLGANVWGGGVVHLGCVGLGPLCETDQLAGELFIPRWGQINPLTQK